MKIFHVDVDDLVEIYNHAPQILQKQAIKVSLTERSLINKSHEQIILTNSKNGNYWVIATEEENYWLFPKDNIKIDNFNIESFKCLFEIDNYDPQVTNLLVLVKPAIISLMPNGREWKLEDLGEINFLDLQPSIDLKNQLELANQEITHLKLQLDEVNKERDLLQNNLTQLQADIQRERQERQKLLSLIETNLNNQSNEISHIKNDLAAIKNQNLPAPSKIDAANKLILETKQFLQDIRIIIFTEVNQHNLIYHNQKKKEVELSYDKLNRLIKQLENNESRFSVAADSQSENIHTQQARHIISWLKAYNQNPESFEQYQSVPLTITDESIHQFRLGINEPIVLEYSRRGNYWIFQDNNNGNPETYLLPKPNLKINEYGIETVKLLFEVSEKAFGNYTELKVIAPAIVVAIGNNQWQLKSLGKIIFM